MTITTASAGYRRKPYFGYNDDPTAFYNGYPFFTSGAQKARNGGANIARFPVDWGFIESTQGDYDWTHIDLATAACDAAGLHYMFAVVNAPAWSGSGTETILYPQGSTELANWQDFCVTLEDRFPRAIFQAWNEPNLTDYGGASASDMAAIVDAMAEALPTRTIVAPGMSPAGGYATYLSDMWGAITANNVDGGLHSYFSNAAGVDTQRKHQAKVQYECELVRSLTTTGKVWVTEGGCDTRNKWDAATIGLARAGLWHFLSKFSWIESVVFHRLRQTTDGPGTWEYDGDWGVMTNLLTAKESYTTIQLFRELRSLQ